MNKKSMLLGLLIGLLVVPAITLGATLITNSMLADKAVSSRNLGYGSVTRNAILNGAVSGAKIAAGTITNSRLADNSFSASKLGKDCVTNVKIADEAVTEAEIESTTRNTLMQGWMRGGIGSLDFPSIAAQDCINHTIDYSPVADINEGDAVLANPVPIAGGINTMDLTWNAWVSDKTTEKITIRICNPTNGALDPASQNWLINVWLNFWQ